MNQTEQKTEIVRIRLTPALKALIEAEANKRAESISTVIRWAIYDRYYGNGPKQQPGRREE